METTSGPFPKRNAEAPEDSSAASHEQGDTPYKNRVVRHMKLHISRRAGREPTDAAFAQMLYEMLIRGAEPNDEEHATLFELAAKLSRVDTFPLPVDAEKYPQFAGMTTLHALILLQSPLLGIFLMGNGEANPRDARGDTPLTLACKNLKKPGMTQIVTNLLDSKKCSPYLETTSPQHPNSPPMSALDYAMQYMRSQPLGSDWSAKTGIPLTGRYGDYGDTPLIWACRHRDIRVVEELMHYPDALATPENNFGETVLHAATANFWNGVVLLPKLLEDGRAAALVNVRNAAGETALFNAARRNDAGAIKTLLKYHASPLVTNRRGERALNVAIEYGAVDAFKMLYEAEQPGHSEDQVYGEQLQRAETQATQRKKHGVPFWSDPNSLRAVEFEALQLAKKHPQNGGQHLSHPRNNVLPWRDRRQNQAGAMSGNATGPGGP